jgi:hypothetical protein
MAAESHNYGFSGSVKTIAASVGATPTTSGTIHSNSGALANGIQKYTHTDSCDTSNQMSSYHFQPSWGETVDNTGVHSTAYADNGTITATSSNGTSTTTVAGNIYQVRAVGFAGAPALADPVTGPSFAPANGDRFGYEAEAPPPSEPQPIPPPQEPMGPSWWEATKALGGQAEPSVQTKFNQSVSDRSWGTASAFVAAGSGGLISHVGGQPYDAENFASAQQFAGGVILTVAIVTPFAASADAAIAEGGLANVFSSSGNALGETGESLAGRVGSDAVEGEEVANGSNSISKALEDEPSINSEPSSCFCAGTLVLCSQGLQRIETIGVGRRVLTGPSDESGPSLDPAKHRLIRLSFVKEGQEFLISFLRRASTVEGLGAGDFVQISLMEVKVVGQARVLAVEPCPPIEEGRGRVVTGTIRSHSVDVRLLKLRGLETPIEVTGNHPVFSEDRPGFHLVSELNPGERLRTRDGVAIVESVSHMTGYWEVFNLEVGDVHQYYVTERHVLVHNLNGGEDNVPLGDGPADPAAGDQVGVPEPAAAGGAADAVAQRIAWLQDEIEKTENTIDGILNNPEQGFYRNRVDGSQMYLNELAQELARLLAGQGG